MKKEIYIEILIEILYRLDRDIAPTIFENLLRHIGSRLVQFPVSLQLEEVAVVYLGKWFSPVYCVKDFLNHFDLILCIKWLDRSLILQGCNFVKK